MKKEQKIIGLVGIIVFLTTIGLSLAFYMERIAFGDASFQLFTVIRTGDFAIQVLRFGSAITQVFPLVSYHLHLDLKTIAILYSLSFELIYFVVFLIVLFRYKDYSQAFLVIWLKILITTHTFFWVQSELLQGLVFLVFFFAWIKNKNSHSLTSMQHCLLFLFVFTLAFFHPLIIFPYLFGFIYYYFFKKDEIPPKTIQVSVLLFVFLFFFKNIFFKNYYDTGAMSGLRNFKELFPNYIDLAINKQFLFHCLNELYFLPFLFLFLLVCLVVLRKWSLLLFTFVFSGVYFSLVQITNITEINYFFRIESFYLPLVFMAGLVATSLFSIRPKWLYTLSLLSIVSLLFFAFRVFNVSDVYTAQLNYNRKLVSENLSNKIVVREVDIPSKKVLLAWALPYQSWLISTIEQNQTASIALADYENSLDWTLANKNAFVTQWGVYPYTQMPKQYFIFGDNDKIYEYLAPK